MASFTDYLEAAVLNHVFRNTALASPATVYFAIYTTAPSDSGGGTEVSGAGYARQPITFGAPAGDPSTVTSTNEVTFDTSAASGTDAVAAGIFDAASGGNLLAWKVMASETMSDTLTFAAGDVSVDLD